MEYFNEVFAYEQVRSIKVLTILEEILGHRPTWKDLTDDNLLLLMKYMQQRYKITTVRGYANSIKTTITRYSKYTVSKNYKTILNVNLGTEARDKTFLTRHDMFLLENCETDDPYEIEARTIFFIMAYTGASYNDVCNFTKDNVNTNKGTLFYTTENDGVDICMPAHENLLKYILAKTDIATKSRNCLLNRKLKSLSEKAGITDSDGEGNRKCDTIKFRTAQKTFATMMYHNGVPVEDIQRMMGLTIRRSAVNYIVGYVSTRKNGKKQIEKVLKSL